MFTGIIDYISFVAVWPNGEGIWRLIREKTVDKVDIRLGSKPKYLLSRIY